MKNKFSEYSSNTYAGTCNNYMLVNDKAKTITGRIYYKVIKSGEFDYKFMFSNNVDSTFADGAVAYANLIGDKFTIISAFAGDGGEHCTNFDDVDLHPILFENSTSKDVQAGEIFFSDSIKLDIKENHYLVFEWTVIGSNIPFTPDKIIPSFIKKENEYIKNVDFPQPHLVACKRNVIKKIAFIGDSITQGLGTEYDCYEFWVAQIGEMLTNEYSIWNLGLGYARAQDVASDGVWLNKAKQAELIFICFGVNDIQQGRSENQICSDLHTIIMKLIEAECEVGIFTIPPFDFENHEQTTWINVNKYIKKELSKITKYVFDTVPVLGQDFPNENKSKYGAHPNGNGGYVLAKSFIDKIDIR